MGNLLNIVTPLHTRTQRDCLTRMLDDKVNCMLKAKEYGADYWDGDRRYGYGGYRYDGRWEPVARALVERYALAADASVLDVGCGKGYLLYELQRILPDAHLVGIDISTYAIASAKPEIADCVSTARAQDSIPVADNAYDLVVSLGCLHNLRVFDLHAALAEIERVGRHKYVMVESYRSDQELFNLQCWALTAESFFDTDEWVWVFQQAGYTGDYEFIFF